MRVPRRGLVGGIHQAYHAHALQIEAMPVTILLPTEQVTRGSLACAHAQVRPFYSVS
jgi:hypothetical protein